MRESPLAPWCCTNRNLANSPKRILHRTLPNVFLCLGGLLSTLVVGSCSLTESEFSIPGLDQQTSASNSSRTGDQDSTPNDAGTVGSPDNDQLARTTAECDKLDDRASCMASLCMGRDCADDSARALDNANDSAPTINNTASNENAAPTQQLASSCTDQQQNGDETGVDCGGDCPIPCTAQQGCLTNGDCEDTLQCSTAAVGSAESGGICTAASCQDELLNGAETDVDCGGDDCPACLETQLCTASQDCLSLVCGQEPTSEIRRCAQASCQDEALNQTETDIDCGGPCSNKCSVQQSCAVDSDCDSGVCEAQSCQPVSCSDNRINGLEADVDCGAPASGCPLCVDEQICSEDEQCESLRCTETCQPIPPCSDELLNGDESDIDCGGSCDSCIASSRCNVDTDCSSGTCVDGTCCGTAGAECLRCAESFTPNTPQCNELDNGQDQLNCRAYLDCLFANADVCTSLNAPNCSSTQESRCNGNFFGGILGVAVLAAEQIVLSAFCLP